jgi:hypothetical protein
VTTANYIFIENLSITIKNKYVLYSLYIHDILLINKLCYTNKLLYLVWNIIILHLNSYVFYVK